MAGEAGMAGGAGTFLPFPPVLPFLPDDRFTIVEIRADRFRGALVERDDPLLPALAEHANPLRSEIDVVEIDAGELAQAQARCIEQFEDREVAATQRRTAVGRAE